MSEWFPQVVRIQNIQKHPNADALEIATVLNDYPVVIKLGEFKVNDLACYFPVDTIVPDIEQFHFLSPKQYEMYEENGEVKSKQIGPKFPVGAVPEKYRVIKAKKIRDIFSMGMLVTLPKEMNEGDSVVELFSLKKLEEEVDDNVVYNGVKIKKSGGNQEPPPKGWEIPYYDIEGARKYINCFLPNEEIVLLAKINGSNSGFCHDGNRLYVKSRNFYKKNDENCMWWDLAVRYNLEEKLSKYPMKVFFGECCGQVKKFRYNAQINDGKLQTKLFIFDIYDVVEKRYLDYEESLAIVKELGLDYVPEIYKGPWLGKEIMYPLAEGKSPVDGITINEGWVMKPLKERFEPRLKGRWQVKLISQGYSLSKGS